MVTIVGLDRDPSYRALAEKLLVERTRCVWYWVHERHSDRPCRRTSPDQRLRRARHPELLAADRLKMGPCSMASRRVARICNLRQRPSLIADRIWRADRTT